MTYYIKYGNRLYLAREDIHKVLWTHNVNEAITLLSLAALSVMVVGHVIAWIVQ